MKFGLYQLISMEPYLVLPSTVFGHVAYHCNHVVRSPDENNNIKNIYIELELHDFNNVQTSEIWINMKYFGVI